MMNPVPELSTASASKLSPAPKPRLKLAIFIKIISVIYIQSSTSFVGWTKLLHRSFCLPGREDIALPRNTTLQKLRLLESGKDTIWMSFLLSQLPRKKLLKCLYTHIYQTVLYFVVYTTRLFVILTLINLLLVLALNARTRVRLYTWLFMNAPFFRSRTSPLRFLLTAIS